MAAFATTGYLKFVKVFEVLGGLLVAIPKTRRAGLLILGPILINILAFHAFLLGGEGLFSPMLGVLCLLALFLVWTERSAFVAFLWGARLTKDSAPPLCTWHFHRSQISQPFPESENRDLACSAFAKNFPG